MASEGLHEDASSLSNETIERHRAWVSLKEELEAIDWYDQRIDASKDAELRAILVHNRDEEKEHAADLLAWLAKRDTTFGAEVAKALGGATSGPPGIPAVASDGSLGIGSLRRRTT